MSIELKDARLKITPEIDVWLEAESRASGKDRAEIMREVLQATALRRIHDARVLTSLALTQGVLRESQGIAGIERDRSGGRGR